MRCSGFHTFKVEFEIKSKTIEYLLPSSDTAQFHLRSTYFFNTFFRIELLSR